MRLKRLSLILILFVGLSLSGCRKVALHQNLQETEVNEILVTLSQGGIEATKEREEGAGTDVTWKIMVKEEEQAKARQILMANNLPRKKELGLEGVYKEAGLIPTPDEQRARFLLAKKGDIINALREIPGVVGVSVVLNVPDENKLSDPNGVKERPTASVVIKTRNEEYVAQTVTEAKIQRWVANTVNNLDPNDVVVILSRSDSGAIPNGVSPSVVLPTTTGIASTAAASAQPVITSNVSQDTPMASDSVSEERGLGRYKVYIVLLFLLLIGISSFLVFFILRSNQAKMKSQQGMAVIDNKPMVPGGASPSGYLGDGGMGQQQGMEGTFDVGSQKPF